MIRKTIAAAIALILYATSSVAEEPRLLGEFGTWSAHVLAGSADRMCYVHGTPVTSKGKYTRRDDTYIQVIHRPAARTRNEIGVTAGYTYRSESEVEIDIDGKGFNLFTDRDTAWAREKADERAMVRAMKAGRTMVVHGTSRRGTLTTDTYSLKGFTAAHNAIGKACGSK